MKHLLILTLSLFSTFAFATHWEGAKDFVEQGCKVINGGPSNISLDGTASQWVEYFKENKIGCTSHTLLLNEASYVIGRYKMSNTASEEDKTEYDVIFFSIIDNQQKVLASSFSWIVSEYKIEFGFDRVIAEDGIELATLYGRFLSSGPYSTVLQRSPYVHDNIAELSGLLSFLASGYNIALQGVRGTYLSGGDFTWLNPIEIEDGHSMINWAKRFFAEDSIILVGTSYDGFAALAAAIDAPEEVKLVISGSGPTDVKRHSFTAGQIAGYGLLSYYFTQENYDDIPSDFNAFKLLFSDKTINSLMPDLLDDQLLGKDNNEWDYLLQNYADISSPFWEERGIIDRLGDISAETYIIGGMIDDQDSLDSYDNFKSLERAFGDQDNYHYILGNWGHSYPSSIQSTIVKGFLNGEKAFPGKAFVYSQVDDELREVSEFPASDQKYLEVALESDQSLNEIIQDSEDTYYVYDPSQVDYSLMKRDLHDSGWLEVMSETLLTGVGRIELELELVTKSIDLYFYFYIKDAESGKWKSILSNQRIRKRVVKDGNGPQKVVVDIPPHMLKLKEGDLLYIGYSHHGPYLLRDTASDKSGIDFFKDFEKSILKWTTAPNVMGKVYLPIEERVEKAI